MTPEAQSGSTRVLVGGVPFGRDNVGDEAILECIVGIIRECSPDSPISVSTDDPKATAEKLGVTALPLFGFDPPGFDPVRMDEAIRAADVFVWAGATGLSDYPDIPLRMMQHAQCLGKKTVMFGCGMNDELNPALYRLQPGKRQSLYRLVRQLSFGAFDLERGFNAKRVKATLDLLKEVIPRADLAVFRDEQSRAEVARVIGTADQLQVGSDPAIRIKPVPVAETAFDPAIRSALGRAKRKIGLCISAQRPCREQDEFVALLDRLIDCEDLDVFGIPMNPITDFQLMREFKTRMGNSERFHLVEGRFEPDEIAGLAAEMDVVISSRLHLLILASITDTPIIGISRGSKVTNYTGQFGLPDVGNVDRLDHEQLESEVLRLLRDGTSHRRTSRAVLGEMEARLERSIWRLGEILQPESTVSTAPEPWSAITLNS